MAEQKVSINKSSQRDASKIKAILKEVGNQVITTEGCVVTFPVLFETIGLAQVGAETHFYGLFKISTKDGNYFGIHSVMAIVHSQPDEIETVIHEETQEPYYVLTYNPGSVVISNTDLLQNKNVPTKIFEYFISRGKVPYFLSYEDIGNVFNTSPKYAGVSLGSTFETLSVPISIIARNPKDYNQYYREILNDIDPKVVLPVYVPASSVNFSATSALTKLTGSYFYQGVVSAINNPTERAEPLDYILTY